MSKIEWTDVTWNPVTGCTKVSEGCRNCYAERMAKRFNSTDGDHFAVNLRRDRLEQPLHWRKPRTIFVCSMGDLFHKHVPFEFIERVFEIIRICDKHEFIILTKRPERVIDYWKWRQYEYLGEGYTCIWPKNAILGVSVENQATANERVPFLLQSPACRRVVSYEPALGTCDFTDYLPDTHDGHRDPRGGPWVDGVICGGESGPGARPMDIEWARSARDQCAEAGVPFFFKQWGEWSPDCLCATARPHRQTPRPGPGPKGCMFRCGKTAAGRMLDGRTHDDLPWSVWGKRVDAGGRDGAR